MKLLARNSLFGISLFSLILLAAGATPAANNNVLTIKCVDESGKALVGAKVQISMLGTGQAPKWNDKKTDATGTAKFDKLEDGVYRVVARPEGLEPGLYELALLRNGAQESGTVTCKPGDPLKKFYFEDPTLNTQARASMNEAMAAFQKNSFEEAEKALRASLAANPSLPDTLYYLAVALIQEKKWGEAESVLKTASRNANALVALPAPKNAKGEIQPSPFAPVQQMINNLLPMLPSLKLRVEGNDAMASKNYKLAIAKFEEAAKAVPNDPDTHYNLALAYAQDKQFDAATAEIEKSITLKPDDKAYTDLKGQIAGLKQNALLEKAKVLLDEGNALYKDKKDYAGALKKYEAALPMIPESAQGSTWAQIGRAHTMLKEQDAAVQAYKKAIDLDPKNVENKKALALHYLLDKQYDLAFETYEAAGISVFKLGQDWTNQSQSDPNALELALRAYERVMKTDPQNAEVYFELGTLYYYNKKDNAKAKEMFTKYQEMGKDEKKLSQVKDLLAVIERKK